MELVQAEEKDNISPNKPINLTNDDPQVHPENNEFVVNVLVEPSDEDKLDTPKKTDNAPKLPYRQLFLKFIWFGCRGTASVSPLYFAILTLCDTAFGGPVAQINLMRQELVDHEEWITKERFNRVYGVYQVR